MLTNRSYIVRAAAGLLACLWLAAGAAAQTPAAAVPVIEGVAHVVDGDTLDIAGTRIRVHGIDAPEADERCTRFNGAVWACGPWATEETRRRFQGEVLRCHDLGERTHDRVVAQCLHEGEDIALALVRDGVVLSCPRYAAQHPHSRPYMDAEKEAAFAGLGLHVGPPAGRGGFCLIAGQEPPVPAVAVSLPDPTTAPPVPGCDIKGNLNRRGDRIYHLPGQVNYNDVNMNAPGNRWFCTETEARAAGWRPAMR